MTSETSTVTQFLRVEEAAQHLRIGRTLCWRLVRESRLKSVRLGDRVLIPATALEELARTAVGDE